MKKKKVNIEKLGRLNSYITLVTDAQVYYRKAVDLVYEKSIGEL